MKIATYNVRNLYDDGTFVDPDSGEPVQVGLFNERVAYFTEQFRALDLDIICLQEIGGEKGVALIGETLGYDYFFAKPNRRGIRMAVLYKKELASKIKCESVSFGELPIPSIQEEGDTSVLKPIKQRRDVLTIDVTTENSKPLRIVTFHLKSMLPEYLEGEDREHDATALTNAKFRCIFYKMMELRALRTYASNSFNEGKELIFLGDFNDNNNSSGIDILKSGVDENSMLYDIFVGYEGDKTTHHHRGNKLTFDTMLVSKGIKESIKHIGVENKELKDYSILPQGAIEYEVKSDHALVWVEIED